MTGSMAMMTRSAGVAITSMARSYVVAGLVISLLLLVVIGDWRMGLLAIIPNLLPIVMVLGLIGWLGLRFDMFTMLSGTIAVGIVVDDTIHFMVRFRQELKEGKGVAEAVRETLSTTGVAMLITTVVLSSGFLIYTLSVLNTLVLFGLLTGLCVTLALLADFLVAPALMTLAGSRFSAGGGKVPTPSRP